MAQLRTRHIIIVGAGIGGLTAAALLAQAGYQVTVLESQTYPGGCASTFTHSHYHFDSGATVAGGFQANGPFTLIGKQLGIEWPVRLHDPAWSVYLAGEKVSLTKDNYDVLRAFPESRVFWDDQAKIADTGWSMAAFGLPWPLTSMVETLQLVQAGLAHFPQDLRLIPLAFQSVYHWLKAYKLTSDAKFVRFIDAQLLISAQTTSRYANALYSATALDLARQGVYHVTGGMGGLAEVLVKKVQDLGGEVLFRRRVNGIKIENGVVTGVRVQHGLRAKETRTLPCDFVIANVTPWSLDQLLGEKSPKQLRREVQERQPGWGAFALHLGIANDRLPDALKASDHYQIVNRLEGPLEECGSLFMSLSPEWDTSRAPQGHRAVTVTTHTRVDQWWDVLKQSPEAYEAFKHQYAERVLHEIEALMPGFRSSIDVMLPGSPVTYEFYTQRYQGMVGGFPQTSLFRVRSPMTGVPNLRLVGDSIFPGQSTAGVMVGAVRVTQDVARTLPRKTTYVSLPTTDSSR